MKDTLKVVTYGDNIDTDAIIAARYLNTFEEKELAKHCMEDIDPLFHKKAGKKSIVVAGENFGCGSSREHAPIALRAAGVKYVIAKSFARIFYRNAVNIGLAIIECPEVVNAVVDGEEITVDTGAGKITVRGNDYSVPPFPEFLQSIIESGGLVQAVRRGDVG